jgi:hypothetical protein
MARGSFVANENIRPSRFVKLDTTSGATGKVLQAGAGDNVYGVSQQWTRNAPLTGLDDGYAAIAGENVRVYTAADPADEPYIEVDAAYVQGTLLKPSTNGIATSTVTNLDIAGAVLLEQSTAANQLVKCRVIAPYNLST